MQTTVFLRNKVVFFITNFWIITASQCYFLLYYHKHKILNKFVIFFKRKQKQIRYILQQK